MSSGETITTDTENDGATPADPVETSVTAGIGGVVSISETAAASPPVGYSLLGANISISAPSSSVSNPIRIVIRIDASAVPVGQDEITVQLLRNGVALPDCTGATGIASPDPCITLRERLGDGDIEITALTSAASLWQLATVTATPTPTPTPTLPDTAVTGSSNTAVTGSSNLRWMLMVSVVAVGFLLLMRAKPLFLHPATRATGKSRLQPQDWRSDRPADIAWPPRRRP